ncbi:MAG: sugar ABC transporter permease, partial [Lacrimispora sp.]
MAKTITEAQKQEKIAALQKEREALSLKLKTAQGTGRRDGLIAKIETIDEKIKKVRTGERFTRQEKRDMVAYSFIAPNFIGFAVFTLGPIIFALVLAFMKWDGNSPMQFA